MSEHLIKHAVVILVILLTGVLHQTEASVVNGDDGNSDDVDYSKLAMILIPGFSATQLRSWSKLDCPYTPLNFNALDLVWLDITMYLTATNCWLKCMMLDPYNQTDHPECRSRPETQLHAITELYPGYITGPLTSEWKDWVKWCIVFGMDANAIVAAPYDWRLSPSKLEERDLYFHRLKLTFETTLKLRGRPSVVIGHSMGNNVFRYFLEWLKLDIAPKEYMQWLDDHIHTYFAVDEDYVEVVMLWISGAPFLGSVQTVEATITGFAFGSPVSEGIARLMFNTFGSSLWMLPFSKYCRTEDLYTKRFSGGHRKNNLVHHCEQHEFSSKYSGWPTNIITIKIPTVPGSNTSEQHPWAPTSILGEVEAYPSIAEDKIQTNLSKMGSGFPIQLSFSAREVADGSFYKVIENIDPDIKKVLYRLDKFYLGDPVLNPLTPWERPPLKNIFCIYGINSKTEVGYYFAPSEKPYPDNWIKTDVIYEQEGSLLSRSGNHVEGNPGAASGDEMVSYNSLSWCKTWLGPRVNITRTPQSEHEGSDVQVELNVEHHSGADVVPSMKRSPEVKYVTYYEDSESISESRTSVWEIDKVSHGNIIKSPVLMRELWLEIWHDVHPKKQSKFVTKAKRRPMRNEDCYWDYLKARCAWSEYCEYRFLFGDLHPSQSCRVKGSSADVLLHYI